MLQRLIAQLRIIVTCLFLLSLIPCTASYALDSVTYNLINVADYCATGKVFQLGGKVCGEVTVGDPVTAFPSRGWLEFI